MEKEKRWSWISLLIVAIILILPLVSETVLAQQGNSSDYRDFPIGGIGSRTAVWFTAQLHLTFAAFVLGVPIFAVILEIIGFFTRNERYDKVARDFIRLCLAAYSITALFGGALGFFLIILYPKIWNYLVQIFSPTMYFYAFLLLTETFTLYMYYYLWDSLRDKEKGGALQLIGKTAGWAMIICFTFIILTAVFFPYNLIEGILKPMAIKFVSTPPLSIPFVGLFLLLLTLCFSFSRKLFHICLGVLLNLLGTVLLVTANIWATFMMSPGQATTNEAGEKIINWAINLETGNLINLWTAILNETWRAVNIHRFIANICVGGIIAAAYAAYRFLHAKSEQERAYYDWMGYTGNFIAIMALLPLPFAGYFLGREVYAWNEQMGVNMMGGHFSWFFIMQAILIGIMFFGANYYLWLGLDRIPGGQRYMKFIGWMEFLLIISFLIWITPHNPVATRAEIQEIGGPFHPLIAPFGVMAWKLTAVNVIILTTFLSFLFYRRANKKSLVKFTLKGKIIQAAIIAAIILLVPAIGLWDFTDGSFKVDDMGKTMDFLNNEYIKYLLLLAIGITTIINAFLFLRGRKKTDTILGDILGVNLLHLTAVVLFLAVLLFWSSSYLTYLYSLIGILILTIFFNIYIFWRKRIKNNIISWDVTGTLFQTLIMPFTFSLVLWLGLHGYKSDDITRLDDSIWQVAWVLACMILITSTDAFLLIPAGSMGEIKWGRMPIRSQYVLFMIAIAFVLTMSLMGTVRSGLRGAWHVFGYMKDTSPESFHPSLAFATKMWAIINSVFFLLVAFIFWLSTLGEKKAEQEAEKVKAVEKVALFPETVVANPGSKL